MRTMAHQQFIIINRLVYQSNIISYKSIICCTNFEKDRTENERKKNSNKNAKKK